MKSGVVASSLALVVLGASACTGPRGSTSADALAKLVPGAVGSVGYTEASRIGERVGTWQGESFEQLAPVAYGSLVQLVGDEMVDLDLTDFVNGDADWIIIPVDEAHEPELLELLTEHADTLVPERSFIALLTDYTTMLLFVDHDGNGNLDAAVAGMKRRALEALDDKERNASDDDEETQQELGESDLQHLARSIREKRRAVESGSYVWYATQVHATPGLLAEDARQVAAELQRTGYVVYATADGGSPPRFFGPPRNEAADEAVLRRRSERG